MLGLGRTGLVRLQQRGLAVATIKANESAIPPPPASVTYPPRTRQRRFNKNGATTVTAEQADLQQKYQQELAGDMRSAETLFDIAERAEWRYEAFSPHLAEKAAHLLADPKSGCSKLNDRQLSIILSSFGCRSESSDRAKLTSFLTRALEGLSKNGIALNTLSRNAVMAAKLDNGEHVSVVDELRAFEEQNIVENLGTYEQLARSYSIQGNIQGVIDIMNFGKSSGHEISEHMIESMVYCLAKNKSYDKAGAFAKKYGNAVIRLNCAIARAAIANGDAVEVTNALSAIPSNVNIHALENNRLVLDVFLSYIEAGKLDALDVLRPYLTMSPSGDSLAEYHQHSYLVHRARRALYEGSLETALAIYSIVNPANRSSSLEIQLRDTFVRQLRSSDNVMSFEHALKLASKMEAKELLSDSSLFILEATKHPEHVEALLKNLIADNKLALQLKQKPELKMSLAKILGLEIANKSSSEERKASLLSLIASVFFTNPQWDWPTFRKMESILYSLSGRDVTLVIPTLGKIADEFARNEFASAIVNQILTSKDDPLKYDKLGKLLSSKAVTGLNGNVLQPRLRNLLTMQKPDGADDSPELKLAADLIALTFAGESAKLFNYYRGRTVLVNLLGLEILSLEKANRLVDCLENENGRVGFSYDDMAAGKFALTEMKQPEKAQLLERLRKRSQAVARWQESSLGSLIYEYQHLQSNKEVKPGLLVMLQEIIMSKVVAMQDVPVSSLVTIFANYSELRKSAGYKLKSLASQAFESSIRKVLSEGNVLQASQLWSVKPSFTVDSALSFIAIAVLNNEIELADKLSEELKSSAKTITLGSLETVGKTIGDVTNEKIDVLSEYLTKKFNLKSTQSRRIVKQIKSKQLERLLKSNKHDEAFNLARDESEAAGAAFCQYELLDAAFTSGNMQLMRDVYHLVQKHHGKNIAVLDLAFTTLMHGKKEQAANLLSAENLHISGAKLDFFVGKCISADRPDVLLNLFLNLSSSDEKAKNVDLNRLLLQLGKLYYKASDFEALSKLETTLESISFPMETQVRSILDISKNKAASVFQSKKAA